MEFLSLKNNAFALDISDYSLKILKLKKKGKKIVVSSFGEKEIEKGVIEKGKVENHKRLAQIIKEGLLEVKGEKIKTNKAIISLPEEKTFLFYLKTPKLEKEDLFLLVNSESKNFLPLPVENFSLDFEVLPQKENSNFFEVLVCAVEKEILEGYFLAAKEAGIFPIIFEPESLSVCRAIFEKEEKDPLLVVDFGRSKTNFIVFWQGFVRETFSFPLSSQNLTEQIMRSLQVSFEKAEELKFEYGLGKVFKLDEKKWRNEIFEAILPPVVALAQEMRKYIFYYETHDKMRVSKILLVGGGANLKGLVRFLSYETDLKVERANPFLKISSSFPVDKKMGFATAVGLGLLGI